MAKRWPLPYMSGAIDPQESLDSDSSVNAQRERKRRRRRFNDEEYISKGQSRPKPNLGERVRFEESPAPRRLYKMKSRPPS